MEKEHIDTRVALIEQAITTIDERLDELVKSFKEFMQQYTKSVRMETELTNLRHQLERVETRHYQLVWWIAGTAVVTVASLFTNILLKK